LKISLLDLQQAPRVLFSRLIDQLHQLGFEGSKADTSLYNFHHDTVHIFILIYMENIIVTSLDIKVINIVFLMKDLGPLFFFSLSVETLHNGHDLFITQGKFIACCLRKVYLDKVKPCPTLVIFPKSKVLILGPQLYKSIVKALHYLGFTRRDTVYSVHHGSKFTYQLEGSQTNKIIWFLIY